MVNRCRVIITWNSSVVLCERVFLPRGSTSTPSTSSQPSNPRPEPPKEKENDAPDEAPQLALHPLISPTPSTSRRVDFEKEKPDEKEGVKRESSTASVTEEQEDVGASQKKNLLALLKSLDTSDAQDTSSSEDLTESHKSRHVPKRKSQVIKFYHEEFEFDVGHDNSELESLQAALGSLPDLGSSLDYDKDDEDDDSEDDDTEDDDTTSSQEDEQEDQPSERANDDVEMSETVSEKNDDLAKLPSKVSLQSLFDSLTQSSNFVAASPPRSPEPSRHNKTRTHAKKNTAEWAALKELEQFSATSEQQSMPIEEADKPLLTDSAVKCDTNEKGVKKAKKKASAVLDRFASGAGTTLMEDANYMGYPFNNSNNQALFCIFDGHAGPNCALASTELFPQQFVSHLATHGTARDKREVFQKTYEMVDQLLLEFEDEGATATTVYLWKHENERFLQAANLGDSYAFLCRNGTAIMLSETHKLTEESEKQRLRDSGIEVHPTQTRLAGLAVSRALGDHFIKQNNVGLVAVPFVTEAIKLTPGDTHLVIASDGLWDIISGQRAMDIIHQQPPSMSSLDLADILLQTALQSSKCLDNVTVIVANLK